MINRISSSLRRFSEKSLERKLQRRFLKTRQTVYLGDFQALTKTRHGHKIVVDTRDMSLSPHILLDGTWEPWIAKVFLDLVEPGMRIVDIGSNVGFYSLLGAHNVGEDGEVVCFEANPHLVTLLFRNLEMNGFKDRCVVEENAVYSVSTDLEFHLNSKHMGDSSIWSDTNEGAEYRDEITTITVRAVTLDDYFADMSKVDFIKIDAEGAEPHILQGAKRIISQNPNIKIMMEFAPSLISKSYGSVDDFYLDISAHGLRVFRINSDSSLSQMELDEAKDVSWTDVLLRR